MGSQSDYSVMKDCEKILKLLKVKYQTLIVSAHRTPKRMFQFAETAEKNGFGVIVAGAGGAAHLAGMVASLTILPSITPDSAKIRLPSIFNCFKHFAGLRTIPSMPSSDISKFDPDPKKCALIEFSFENFKIFAKSSRSFGFINTFAGPPIP